MLTRWGSILKVTHSVVTMGRTDGRRPVNGIPHSSLSSVSRQKRVWIAAYADFKWTLAVVVRRAPFERPIERDSFVTSSFESAVGSFFPPSSSTRGFI